MKKGQVLEGTVEKVAFPNKGIVSVEDKKVILKNAVPGQFVSLYSRNGSKLLPRPISLCEIDKEEGKLRLVYRVTGKGTGTEEFSRLHAGVPVETLGPLGNGFPLDAVKGKKVFLMGGGIGIPPMLETAKELDAEKIKKNFDEDAKVSVVLGELKRTDLLGVELSVISPGIPLDAPFVTVLDEAGVPIWSEIQLAYHCAKGKLAAITGTNGKTTTTALRL